MCVGFVSVFFSQKRLLKMHKTLKNKVTIQYRTGGQVGQDGMGGQGRAARWVIKVQSRVECTAWSKQQESHRASHPWTHTHQMIDVVIK